MRRRDGGISEKKSKYGKVRGKERGCSGIQNKTKC
jgi:hypothetical protein